MPYLLNFDKSLEWSIVSNALLKSINIPRTCLPFWRDFLISSIEKFRAWLVECAFLKPNWFSFRIPLDIKKLYNLEKIIFSKKKISIKFYLKIFVRYNY